MWGDVLLPPYNLKTYHQIINMEEYGVNVAKTKTSFPMKIYEIDHKFICVKRAFLDWA